MSFLPDNIRRDRGKKEGQLQETSPESRLSQAFIKEDRINQPRSSESAESSGSYEEIRTVHNLTPPGLRSATQSGPSSPIDIPRSKRRAATSISFHRDEFKTRPRASRSHTMGSTYSTPPEFSTKPPQYRQYPTPFPRIERSVDEHKEPSSYFEHSVDILSMVAHSPEVVAGVLAMSEIDHRMHGSSKKPPIPSPAGSGLAISREYHDQYQPQAPAALHRKYVAKEAELIMEKLKRQRSEMRSKQDIPYLEATREKIIVRSQNDGAGSDSRRQDLKDELKDLFCEK